MSQLQRAMQGFQNELKRRAVRITKGAYLTELTFSPVLNGQFTVTASWKNKSGSVETFSKAYTPETVLAYSGPRGVKLSKRACRVVSEYIRDVLTQRGVL